MGREQNIPIFLWIATAAMVHVTWGGGASRIADLIEQRLDLKALDAQVRGHLDGSGEMEFSIIEVPATEVEERHEDDSNSPNDSETETETETEQDEPAEERSAKRNEDVKPEDVAEPDKPKPTKKEPEPKKKKPPKKVVKVTPLPKPKKPAEKAAPKVELPKAQGRVAVVQNQDDKEDVDNPDAKQIADKGRKVKVETRARITSTDQNDKAPTPGSAATGSGPKPGNSSEHRIAQSEDSPGEKDQAPNDKAKTTSKKAVTLPPPRAGGGRLDGSPDTRKESKSSKKPVAGAARGTETSKRTASSPSQRGQAAEKATRAQSGSPEIVTAPGGVGSVAKQSKARKGRRGRKGRRRRLPPRARRKKLFGLGAAGRTRNGLNLNLSPTTAEDTIGRGELARVRKRDGMRRRSKHRGSWKAVGIERWRASIENYVAAVRPGNQTALNAARVPFASYLNTIHNRLHPVFANSFLGSLGRLPAKHDMNRRGLKTNLEIVLNRDDGRVVQLGVTRTSGVTAFDVAALESVYRAAPYGRPPKSIVSPDGNVYLHWEFYRDPYYACSTYFARPYIIKVKPKTKPPKIRRPGPFRRKERAVPPAKTGKREPRRPAANKSRHASRE